jgi:hypothetical protein
MLVKNSEDAHWAYCTSCKASGPHADNAEDAERKFALPKPPTFMERLWK